MDGLREISNRRGIPTLIRGPTGVFFFQFIDKDVAYSVRDLKEADVEKQNKFRILLVEEGVLIMWGGRWYISSGLTDADVDKVLESADRAMGRL